MTEGEDKLWDHIVRLYGFLSLLAAIVLLMSFRLIQIERNLP